jgi:phosphoribosyl 1,2-cyclic phosphodiesterase
MKIKFWGTRGSIAVPGQQTIIYGGNTTCLQITLESGQNVVIDAGTGIRAYGNQLAAQKGGVDIYLLMTHIHWDHVLGFPYFRPLYEASNTIRIDGFPTCMKGLRNTFDTGMGDGFFPVKFDDLKAEVTYLEKLGKGTLEIDGAVIESIPLHHPQGGFGFRFRERGKVLVFLTDNELVGDGWAGRSLGEYVTFCEGADILIHDAQYTPREVEERRGWGHSDYLSVFELAHKANIKKLILFHHDPSRTDAEVASIKALCEDLAGKRNSRVLVEAAREGSEAVL